MENSQFLLRRDRPAEWAKLPRVTFVSNSLLPGYRSSELLEGRLREFGRILPSGDEYPSPVLWLQFPVVPLEGSGGNAVLVEMYIIPVMAPRFIRASISGQGWEWCRNLACSAIAEARKDGVAHVLGWGAATKMAVDHGAKFLAEYPLLEGFASTHGDVGTSYLVLESIRRAGVRQGSRFAVIGANGAIGDLLSRALAQQLEPESILLVGKQDKRGEYKNLHRLEELRQRVQNAGDVDVCVSQDKTRACIDHDSHVIIVGTNGDMTLSPDEVPPGALVFDITAPAACRPDPGWEGKLVLTAGCGKIASEICPLGFGNIEGQKIYDVGAGGDYVLWGCFGETIASAMFSRKDHVAGRLIPLSELDWCKEYMPRAGIEAQPPVSFGRELEWEEVSNFVRQRYND